MPRRAGLGRRSIAEGSSQYRDRYAEPESVLGFAVSGRVRLCRGRTGVCGVGGLR